MQRSRGRTSRRSKRYTTSWKPLQKSNIQDIIEYILFWRLCCDECRLHGEILNPSVLVQNMNRETFNTYMVEYVDCLQRCEKLNYFVCEYLKVFAVLR